MFGYPPRPDAIASFNARAIFNPKDQFLPLDILGDRSNILFAGKEIKQEDWSEQHKTIASHLFKAFDANRKKIEKEVKRFSVNSQEVLRMRFDWDMNDLCEIIFEGSPNGSYGYFYLSFNLVKKEIEI
jgi:hypothetical protein